MASSLPAVVLVHGAWHTPAIYQPYIESLEAAGFKVICPHLPSCTGESPPKAFLDEDVACVRNVVKGLVQAGERVLMIMHSWGTVVGPEATTDDLIFSLRKAQGKEGGVIHFLALCGYLLQPGVAITDIVTEAGFYPLLDKYMPADENGLCFPLDPAQVLLSGMPQPVIDEAVSHLVRFPMKALETKVTGDAWKRVPSTTVIAKQDFAVPQVYQDIMIPKAEAAGIKLNIKQYDTIHSVFLAKTKEMTELALEAARDPRNSI